MDKIYILDAINYLFRSYYAIGPMTNSKGESTSALYGFIRSIQKLLKETSPEYLVCVFDGPDNKKSRQAVYADYKMHRKGAPEDLFPQFDWAYTFCQLSGIPVLCVEGVEADDTMASVARFAAKKGAKTYLCTSDKDLMQLVGGNTFLLHPAKDYMLVDAAKVKELYGVRPDQMLDFLAIMGDSSDNIPGLEGFGPKTAASLLQEFGTLDEILKNPDKVKGEKKQEILRTQKETALLSRQLATLDTEIEVPQSTDFYKIQEANQQKLSAFYHEMQFNTLLRELNAQAPKPPPSKKTPKRHTDKHAYHLVDTKEALIALLERLSKEPEVGLDVETTGLNPMTAELVGIGFCYEPGEAWYVPLNGNLGEKQVLEELKTFFETAKCAFFGHNIKYDEHILRNVGISLEEICFDTLLASYLLNPQSRKHNLDDLSLERFKRVKIPIESLIGKRKKEISMRDVEIEKVKEYCCEDIDYTTRLKELFEEELEEKKLDTILYDIELKLLPVLLDMERTGIYLDAKQLQGQEAILSLEIEKLKTKIFSEIGIEFNLNSPKQLSEVLFDRLGLKKPKKGRTEFSTGAAILEELKEENPIVGDILQYRGLEKLRSTYIEALPESIDAKTGRIHCTFNQSVTATGRLSCQNPNLQNIPVRTKEGMAIRSCFKPQKPGWSYIGGDYSQIELRLLAHFSEDEELLRAFRAKADVHAHTASLVFNIPIEMVTPEMRSRAKAVNFGIIYGQGPFGLAQQLHISQKEASEFIKTYFERYPKILDFLESCKSMARKTGVSTTFTGRQRPIPEILNKNPMIRAAAERLAVNTPLQGTAADMIKLAMIDIDKAILDKNLEGKMILQIHDELIFEVPDHEIPLFKALIQEKMEKVFKLKVPIEVDIAVGKNWAAC